MADLTRTPFRDYVVDVAKVIEGAAAQDYAKVQAYATQLVEKLAANGEKDCSKRLQQALGKAAVSTLSLARTAFAPRIPADTESRVPTADEEEFEPGAIDLVLPEEAVELVRRLITNFQHAD